MTRQLSESILNVTWLSVILGGVAKCETEKAKYVQDLGRNAGGNQENLESESSVVSRDRLCWLVTKSSTSIPTSSISLILSRPFVTA